MSSEEQVFKKLTRLEIKLSDVESNTAFIYANDRNQVAVTVSVQMINTLDKPLVLSEEDLRGNIYFCDYSTGQLLSDDWTISATPGDYVGAVEYGNTRKVNLASNPEITTLSFYFSGKKAKNTQSIAVGITTDVGKFDTTKDGTSTINGPASGSGSVFKSPKYISLNTLIPLNYSTFDTLNLSGKWMNTSSMTTISDSIPCILWDGSSEKARKDKGQSYRGVLVITPENKNCFFVKKIIHRNKITNPGLNLVGYDGSNQADIISGMNTRDINSPTPWRVYDTSFVFIDSKTFGIKNDISNGLSIKGRANFKTNDWYLKLKIDSGYVFTNQALSDKNLTIAMLHLQHCAYFNAGEEWVRDGWDSNHRAEVSVFDNYGNFGTIVIEVNGSRNNPGQMIINNTPLII
ncbi:TPA: hypothetical protein R4229_004292 [Morganella morganii]|nr:hypothetical protein [Morganella morganii]